VPGHVPHLGADLHKRYNPIITRMASMEKPILAAVNGVAAGAGCSLALACDMRIAAQEASFIEVFINVGLIPDSGSTWFLPRLVGLGKAMELCTTGVKVDADEALRIGLVNRVVSGASLMDETNALAKKLASLPGRGIGLTKRLLAQSFERTLAEQLDAEAFAQETAGQTQDHFEGVTAFIEKRKPAFTGK
jgi:2-(1,2-epoxy-1,2-dihydrophenyl)acetyl-CoA isomerase